MEIQIEANEQALAEAAALMTSVNLNQAILEKVRATWVASGGSTPKLTFQLLAKHHRTSLNWSRVWVALGDERCLPFNSPDTNWYELSHVLLDKLPFPLAHQLQPTYSNDPDVVAREYSEVLAGLPSNAQGTPRINQLWLGIGEDSHTLSLFPGKVKPQARQLVIGVHSAPKPPPKRISLSLRALTNVEHCLVMASGESKAKAVAGLVKGEVATPIVKAVRTIEKYGGKVTLLVDQAAASLIN
jgi:6-phosphogluconolactonase